MGYGTRGIIRTFWPDDTETEIYIDCGGMFAPAISMTELLQKIRDKWEGASLDNIEITTQYIHTDCLGYDLYDPGDYTTFIKIRRLPGA